MVSHPLHLLYLIHFPDTASKVVSYFSKDTLPKQQQLIKIMMLALLGIIFGKERQRRNNTINAVIVYCDIEEGDICGGRKRCGG